MDEMVKETGVSRYTLMPALQKGELHGAQTKKYGTWRVEEGCLEAWMLGEPCAHKARKCD